MKREQMELSVKPQIDFKKFLARPVGSELLILDTESGEMYQFNESASLIWQSLKEGHNKVTAAVGLTETYNLSTEKAQEEVEHFISQLAEL